MGFGFTAGEIDALRAAVNASLVDRATILRPSTDSDGAGGQPNAPTTVGVNVPCRLEPDRVGQGRERDVGSRTQSLSFWIITFEVGQEVESQDQVTIGSRTFEVQTPLDPQSYQAETAFRCMEIL